MSLFITHRDILWNLVGKNLKARYAGSVLGILWAFINPLLLAAIIGFVFTNIFRMPVENFYLFIIAGMLPWSCLAGALQESALSIPAHVSLLKQFSIPREVVPLSVVVTHFVLFLTALLAVLPIFILSYPKTVMFLPLLAAAVLLWFLFTLGLALLLSSWCVQNRDVHQILGTFLTFWLWLTPVFYSVDMIPEFYRWMVLVNPVYPFLQIFRESLWHASGGIVRFLAVGILLCGFSLAAGSYVFARKEGDFLKRI
ncbi:MAG: ABC transporter permease [Candidatus Omnitrophica bacterium]|nr:ABC transporter permease [Candidatus Omnitrophota bacterium]